MRVLLPVELSVPFCVTVDVALEVRVGLGLWDCVGVPVLEGELNWLTVFVPLNVAV